MSSMKTEEPRTDEFKESAPAELTGAERKEALLEYYRQRRGLEDMSGTGVLYVIKKAPYSKIVQFGFTIDANRKLAEINSRVADSPKYSICALYETDNPLAAQEVEKTLEQIDPGLRHTDLDSGVNGFDRSYKLYPEQACWILRCIAAVNDSMDRLWIWSEAEQCFVHDSLD